jgi:hypothetical protein
LITLCARFQQRGSILSIGVIPDAKLNEAAMITDFAVAKQSGQQGQALLSKGGVKEGRGGGWLS